MDNRFPKSRRLLKRWQFLRVQGQGDKVVSRYFIGVYVMDDTEGARLGITTTRRLGNAVARNRLRRVVREAYRRHVLSLPPGFQVVVIPKKYAVTQSSERLTMDLHSLGNKLFSQWRALSC